MLDNDVLTWLEKIEALMEVDALQQLVEADRRAAETSQIIKDIEDGWQCIT